METMKRDSKRSKKGLVLPVIAAIAICLALLGLGVLQLGFGSRLMATRTMAGVSARAAADAGVTRALYELNHNFTMGDNPLTTPMPPDASGELNNSNATYSYKVRGPLTELPEPYWVIESIGKLGTQEKKVYTTLGVRNLFDYGLIVTEKIDLKEGTLIDGYISHDIETGDKYDYGSILPDGSLNAFKDVRIGTTYSGHDTMIDLRNNAVVYGQVLVGVGGDPEEIIQEHGTPGPTVTGGCGVMSEPWLFDPDLITINPADFPDWGEIDKETFDDSGLYYYTIDNTGGAVPLRRSYADIDMPTSTPDPSQTYRIVILGHVELYVPGDMLIGTRSMIFVGGDPLADPPIPYIPSSLIIYLDGNLNVANSAEINNLSEIPATFQLYGTGQPYQSWNINNGGYYYGIYYGPNAVINIVQSAQFFGSVSGYNFVLNQNAALHYDTALAGEHEYDIGFGIDRMWEKSDFIVAAGS